MDRFRKQLRLILVLIFIFLAAAFWIPRQAHAGTIVVGTPNDELDGDTGNGLCSLREAIYNANYDTDFQEDCAAGTGDDIITLPAGTYTLKGAAGEDGNLSGDLDVMGALTINGVHYKNTIIQAGTTNPVNDTCVDCVDRVLDILSGAVVEINGVTIRYGWSPDGIDGAYAGGGSPGGGIRNKGSLILVDCSVNSNRTGNGAYDTAYGIAGGGGAGGGIVNDGTLVLENSVVTNNRTGIGASSPTDSGVKAGSGGAGGGISVYPGKVMTATHTTISFNITGMGGVGSDSSDADAGDGGNGGNGGGVYNNGFSTFFNSTISSNATGFGATGGDVVIGTGAGGDGGDGGDGGGLYQDQFTTSQLELVDSTIRGNITGGPARGGRGTPNGENGEGGDGGGMQVYIGPVVVKGSTFQANEGTYGGGVGLTNAGELTITNSTVSENIANQDGGGIFITGPTTATLVFVTVAANTSELGDGGGIASTGGISISNTILATNVDNGNEHPDCYGPITSGDYNLVGVYNSPDCDFVPLGNDLYGTEKVPLDPVLGALMDNGGPTWTQALGEASLGYDHIPFGVNGCRTVYATDQRGVPRDPTCDVGAYEVEKIFVFLPLVIR